MIGWRYPEQKREDYLGNYCNEPGKRNNVVWTWLQATENKIRENNSVFGR